MTIFWIILIGILLGIVLFFLFTSSAKPRVRPHALYGSSSWHGLNGSYLWSFMTGRLKITGLDANQFKAAYEHVLVNQIIATFDQGRQDAKSKIMGKPRNEIIVNSPLGSVSSWIPLSYANTIYRCGHVYINQNEIDIPHMTKDFDEACDMIFTLTGIFRSQPMSEVLMFAPTSNASDDNKATDQFDHAGDATPNQPNSH